jgi:hypothetical protein
MQLKKILINYNQKFWALMFRILILSMVAKFEEGFDLFLAWCKSHFLSFEYV